ncbi:hypothetical protein QTV49_005068 [Vibrio vulnificus]|nr:hypothetical protein [Vibrio vulnificus]
MNVDLVNTIIDAGAQILSALIPSVAVYIASRKYFATRQAKQTALVALLEVKFFRHFETEACEMLSQLNGKSQNANRLLVRKSLADKDIKTEGKLTPKELDRRIEVYQKALKALENHRPQ